MSLLLPTTHYLSLLDPSSAAARKLAYYKWQHDDVALPQRTIVCVHGLTRNGRDFDYLASHLASTQPVRVISVDIAGRGLSDRLVNPADYNYATYVQDMLALLAHLGVGMVDWVGTSMGGLTALFLQQAAPGIIKRLVLNDIGPHLPSTSLKRIARGLDNVHTFSDAEQAMAKFRSMLAPFGVKEEEHWQHLFRHSLVRDKKGNYIFHFDPRIRKSTFSADVEKIVDVELWSTWEMALSIPTLIIRGTESDILLPTTAKRMVEQHNKAQLVEFPGVGHAPALMDAEQTKMIGDWLKSVS